MRATGIIRRIDDLGRVVIPKEIRRTMRIREGDPLEIFTSGDGEVVLKKHSLLGAISEYAENMAAVLHKDTGFPVAITDRDTIISVSGVPKNELLGRRVSVEIEQIMQERRTFISQQRHTVKTVEAMDVESSVCAPIIASGDIVGCICMLSAKTGEIPSDCAVKMVQIMANFMTKSVEN